MAPAVLSLEINGGNPLTLRLLAAVVEADSRRYADAASRTSENDLVRAFRGAATPSLAIAKFLERLQRCFRFDGSVYVLAAAYLTRFISSPAARDAGILVEPATAHRLVSVAFLLASKFISPRYYRRRVERFEICSDRSIRSSEMCPLELLFLRAVGYRLFITDEEFQQFFRMLEHGPPAVQSCGDRKRKAEAALGAEEEEPRRVRACLPPVKDGIWSVNVSGVWKWATGESDWT